MSMQLIDNQLKASNHDHINNGCATVEKEQSIIKRTSPPRVTYIGDVNIAIPDVDLTLGTVVTCNGPVYIPKTDLIISNENCGKCKRIEVKQNPDAQSKKFKINGPEKKIIIQWTKEKCLILAVSIIVIQMIISCLFMNYLPKNNIVKVKSCNGMCKIEKMHSNLKKFVPRIWGYDHNCRYECGLKNRSRVRLMIVNAKIWPCLFEGDDSVSAKDQLINNLPLEKTRCAEYMENEFNRQTNDFPIRLNDIAYNYLVGYHGFILEGRAINCFDEVEDKLLMENHSEMITLGMPYCFPRETKSNRNNTMTLLNSIRVLLGELKKVGVLKDNFTFEFPDTCNDTLLVNTLKKNNNMSNNFMFYNNFENDMLGVSLEFNQKNINDLLFETEYNKSNSSDTKNVSTSDPSNFPIPLYDTTVSCKNKMDYYNMTYYHYTFILELTAYLGADRIDKNVTEFRREALQVINATSDKPIHYFVYPKGIAFKGTPIECLPMPSDDTTAFIRIFMKMDSHFADLIDIIKSLKLIVNDMRKNNPVIRTGYYTEKNSYDNPRRFKKTFRFKSFDNGRPAIYKLYQMLETKVLIENHYIWKTGFDSLGFC